MYNFMINEDGRRRLFKYVKEDGSIEKEYSARVDFNETTALFTPTHIVFYTCAYGRLDYMDKIPVGRSGKDYKEEIEEIQNYTRFLNIHWCMNYANWYIDPDKDKSIDWVELIKKDLQEVKEFNKLETWSVTKLFQKLIYDC